MSLPRGTGDGGLGTRGGGGLTHRCPRSALPVAPRTSSLYSPYKCNSQNALCAQEEFYAAWSQRFSERGCGKMREASSPTEAKGLTRRRRVCINRSDS
jgi:hypothetical protein